MQVWLWIGFVVLILLLLALDLGVLNRKAHVISIPEALKWTALWVVVALLFSIVVYFMYEYHWAGMGIAGREVMRGHEAVITYLTGYLVEKSLSLDNIFVIALIFGYFNVPGHLQHRTLFWGILAALVFRGLMIAAGSALIHRFEWTIYLFGGILLLTAWRMMRTSHEEIDPDTSWLVRYARKVYPVTRGYHGERFFVNVDGKRAMTPLFLALLVIESTDVMFAVDSIPAIFAITKDPFIVATSNVFAILGLRSLYFALAGLVTKFSYLKPALTIMLGYIGIKMILSHHIHIPTLLSLGVIVGILVVGIILSVLAGHGDENELPAAPDIADADVAAEAATEAARYADTTRSELLHLHRAEDRGEPDEPEPSANGHDDPALADALTPQRYAGAPDKGH